MTVFRGIPVEERMINIKGSWDKDEVKTQIDPNELTVDRGTTVIWINESQSEVKIKFGKGTNCEEVNSKAMGGRLNRNVDPKECFVTRDSMRSAGGTMRVFFTEIGTLWILAG
jgi:plastocyanin